METPSFRRWFKKKYQPVPNQEPESSLVTETSFTSNAFGDFEPAPARPQRSQKKEYFRHPPCTIL